ncbi:GC-rich sequence DNA-binding factor-like protein-domain-containing protein [Amanita rubescens]|nr:GC-rich sequence DNA-binding factor-like protein-domain-containing protein [Amanita rubescens]
MARRKRVLDDGDSDSDVSDNDDAPDFSNDLDAREEYELNRDPYRRKRRRKNEKEDAIYGIFGDESDEDTHTSRAKRHWTKAPAFVSGDKPVDLDKEMDVDVDVDADADMDDKESADGEADGSAGEEAGEENEFSDDSQPSRPPSPRVRVEEEDEEEAIDRPRMGGIGSKSANVFTAFASSSTISETLSTEATAPTSESVSSSAAATPPREHVLPTAFGNRTQRSFVRESRPVKAPTVLTEKERTHFSKLQGSFGAKMLAKMGWELGTGLGATGEGIVNPVESKLRPQKMGIAFKGFKEKTEQSRQEARRKGEVISDDEDPRTRKLMKKAREQEQKKADVWKRPKKVKTKVEHKTYEEILAEAGEEPPTTGLGQIIDATGAIPREVSSIADLSINSWTPTADSTRIPEVRYNIRAIADSCKTDLEKMASEARALEENKRIMTNQVARLQKKIEDEAELISRLQQVSLVVNDIQSLSQELSSVYEISLEPFTPYVYKLVSQFSDEFDKCQLDEIIVAAIAPFVRRMVANWNPLQDPSAFASTFRSWRRALRIKTAEDKPPSTQLDVFGREVPATSDPEDHAFMTPFESLLWTVWLPKVRTAINNEWSADQPQPAVKLYEVWSTFLPAFIRDNMLDQLILPKVQRAIADWSPKKSTAPLQNLLFPWLPHLGLRLEDVIGDAKRKVKSLLRAWSLGQDLPIPLKAWKEVFETNDWDAMLLKYVIPKLGATLRDDFHVNPNPQEQNMEPIQQVLKWTDAIRPSLVQPNANFESVAQWYSFWKRSFPEDVQTMPGVTRGFTRGLQLMNTAYELGPDAHARLQRPDFKAEVLASRQGTPAPKTAKQRPTAARAHEITFKEIVEEFVASHNLLFIPAGRVHERSRMPLYRISSTADGKGGVLIYIQDDCKDKGDWRAIPLEDMVLRATTGR